MEKKIIQKIELLEHLINIEQIKTVFARNLFPRPCQDYKKHFKKYYCLKDLYKLINDENYRKTLGINESNNVTIWISLLCNIKREIPAVQKLFNLDKNNNSLDIT